jgi:hypothetical protein
MTDLPDREATMREKVRDRLLMWGYAEDRALAKFVNDELKSRDEMDEDAAVEAGEHVASLIGATPQELVTFILDAAFGVSDDA